MLPGAGDLGHPLPHHPPELVDGRQPVGRELGDRVDGVAARHPHLDRTDVVEIARDRRLRRLDPVFAEQLDQLWLVGHLVITDQARDRRLPLHLGRHG